MVSVSRNASISDYADFVKKVYGPSNDKHYSLWEMLINIQRFSMRGIKGVRKGNNDKVKLNLLIALSWYVSLMNRLHINTEENVWNRFPYICSYCGKMPCSCKNEKVQERRKIVRDDLKKPKTLEEYQLMFKRIYPPESRTPQEAAIHLAEETGELSEAFHIYMADRNDKDFQNILLESADFYSCVMGIMNSLDINCAEELSNTFTNNCHVCHDMPCTCSFKDVSSFKS
jgi:NTP pyrophosphatase (non-canonical NTP hydrolase)